MIQAKKNFVWVGSDVESLVIKTVELIGIIVHKRMKFTGGGKVRNDFSRKLFCIVELFLNVCLYNFFIFD